MPEDIAVRRNEVLASIEAKQRQLPKVDHNGIPIDPKRRTGAFAVPQDPEPQDGER